MRPVIAALVALLWSGAAGAHAFLDRAVPPVGATVAAAPAEIRLFFIEPVEPAFSGIALATADGRPVAAGRAAADPGDPRQLVLPLPPLPPGRYRVSWHVVSVDTHRTEGDYTFSVNP